MYYIQLFKHYKSLLCVKNTNGGRVVVINWELHNLNLMSWIAIRKFLLSLSPRDEISE